jgi:phosphoesterase RecJ-like protein
MKEKIAKIFREKASFLITAHSTPCGDAIGSELALGSLLQRLGKEVTIINSVPVPPNFLFLPGANKILCSSKIKKNLEAAVVLDCGTIDRVGSIADAIKQFDIIINIDHHISNDYFGTLNYVDVDASATGEQIFTFFEPLVGDVNKEEAMCLYTSIMVDTGSFRYANTKPRTHEIAAHLLKKGVDTTLITDKVYGDFSLANRRLLGLALATLQLSDDGQIAWFKVTRKMYQETGGTENNAHDFIDYIHSMKGVLVSFFLREVNSENVKVSFRSNLVDVARIAQTFGGGGHCRASGCTVKGQMEEVEKKVLETVEKFLPDQK